LILAAGCAVMVAVGLVLVMRAVRPARAPLALRLAALEESTRAEEGRGTGSQAAVGRLLVEVLDPLDERFAALRATLAVTGTSLPTHLTRQAATGLLGAVVPAAMAVVMAAGGVAVPPEVVVIGAVLVGVAGAFAPTYVARAQAAERRAEMRHTLAGYVDLTGVVLAAGEGLETALRHAAAMGAGWSYAELRRALDTARLTRRPAWEALGEAGRHIGVPELVELSEGLALAGGEGARLRDSLAARARTLRDHELTEAESKAGSATEGMSGPLVFLLVGFVVLIGYPALVGVVGGLGR
jgi:tight adherence protein C